ncbi:LPXTG cell wall anchor domain-containing protein [Flavobacterium cerinum]|uniref:LPXTG cell wall anchor domain-containing protein n=1 Tax=Flavobacterium cerinum TaxID=2502784 RepID=A0A3S3Q3E8_9FLAO|nr:LPXTG cell wall anchor domain-containing protein [Flavobacterium cerinum]RWW92349.1 LPXTG cell wall anchor domain-containing protein [Flavobacterium cerinum]
MNIASNFIALQYRTGSSPETGAIVIGALIVGVVLYYINKRKNKDN